MMGTVSSHVLNVRNASTIATATDTAAMSRLLASSAPRASCAVPTCMLMSTAHLYGVIIVLHMHVIVTIHSRDLS